MMRMKLFVVSVFLVGITVPGSADATVVPGAPLGSSPHGDRIGVAAAVSGSVEVSRTGQIGLVVESGAPIFLGDIIETGPEGRLQILLVDETVFTVGPNSSMVMDIFVYHPQTQTGKVQAHIIKGMFRLITGKIARNKPEDMEIQLPSGTIGIRGTILLIEADDVTKKSTAILYGPGRNDNTGSRLGSFVMTNEVNGDKEVTKVDLTGQAARIDGPNLPPSRPFHAPTDLVAKLNNALAPKSLTPTTPQRKPGQTSSTTSVVAGVPTEDKRTATQKAGQDVIISGASSQSTTGLGKIGKKLRSNTLRAAQDSAKEVNQVIPNGPTKWNHLQALSAQQTGIFRYQQLNVTLFDGAAPSGNYALRMNINLGNKTAGGGLSRVTVNSPDLNGGAAFAFLLPTKPFQTGTGPAIFNDSNVQTCIGNTCVANLTVQLGNQNGKIAQTANHSLTVDEAGTSLQGGGIAQRQSGLVT